MLVVHINAVTFMSEYSLFFQIKTNSISSITHSNLRLVCVCACVQMCTKQKTNIHLFVSMFRVSFTFGVSFAKKKKLSVDY